MNEMKYQHNYVNKSKFDSGEDIPNARSAENCNTRVALSTPKNPEPGKIIKCVLDLTLGEEGATAPYILVQLYVFFEIVRVDDTDTFDEDAQEFCVKRALRMMQEKLENLTELCSGLPLVIPLTE